MFLTVHGVDNGKRATEAGVRLTIHVDRNGGQHVDLKQLLGQGSVRATLTRLEKLSSESGHRQAAASPKRT